ncbi:MAG: chemotaxis protein CheW [Deltaproteobacteria bacterium]|nr:chemotaxis protein CheW [Deltaproteobacteria bacterium]
MNSEGIRVRQHTTAETGGGGPARRAKGGGGAAEPDTALTPAQKKQILLARAQALAREDERKRAPEESVRVVEFLLACEKYAVEATYVREVYQLKQLTPLPCTPSFVLGIINVRGRILSVLYLLNNGFNKFHIFICQFRQDFFINIEGEYIIFLCTHCYNFKDLLKNTHIFFM